MKKILIICLCCLINLYVTAQTPVPYLKKNGKWIFTDSLNMKPVLSKEYDDVSFFSEGFAKVELNKKTGYIDKKGKEICRLKYDFGYVFIEGMAQVSTDYTGFIDTKGKEVIALKYDDAGLFSEGLAYVKKDNKISFVNKSGKEITPLKYEKAGYFHENRAWVYADGKYGYVDKSGKEVIPLKYQEANDFINGRAIVRINGFRGVINKDGEEIIHPEYVTISPFQEGLASVSLNGKNGFIDTTGKIIIPIIYGSAGNFNQGITRVQVGGSYGTGGVNGIINKKGEQIVDLSRYESGYPYEGCIIARLKKDSKPDGGKWVLLDLTGKIISDLRFDEIKFDDIGYHQDGIFWVKINGLWGMLDKTGKGVLPFKYKNVGTCKNGFAVVQLIDGQKSFYIDIAGREYREQ